MSKIKKVPALIVSIASSLESIEREYNYLDMDMGELTGLTSALYHHLWWRKRIDQLPKSYDEWKEIWNAAYKYVGWQKHDIVKDILLYFVVHNVDEILYLNEVLEFFESSPFGESKFKTYKKQIGCLNVGNPRKRHV